MFPIQRSAPQVLCAALLLLPVAVAATSPAAGPAGRAGQEPGEPWHHGEGRIGEVEEVLGLLRTLGAVQRQAARLAEARAGNGEVRPFARGVVAALDALDRRAEGLARASGVCLPAPAAARDQPLGPPVSKLAGLRGPVFDTAYLHLVVSEGRKAIRQLEEERDEPGQEEAVLQLLAAAIPELRARVDGAERLWRSLVAGSAPAAGPTAR
jgi:predicted outer membrane protein